jgi:drug/metabolite transporter (DMT)-like permease
VGIVLGVLILDERVSWNQPVGALVVVVGIVISQERLAPALRRRSPRRHG